MNNKMKCIFRKLSNEQLDKCIDDVINTGQSTDSVALQWLINHKYVEVENPSSDVWKNYVLTEKGKRHRGFVETELDHNSKNSAVATAWAAWIALVLSAISLAVSLSISCCQH